jgi:nitrate reductase beta subunit
MVWYVPPLSPIQSAAEAGKVEFDGVLPKIESLRIPVKYLANLLTAGDEKPIVRALKRIMAMRLYKRAETVDGVEDLRALEEVGLTKAQADEMYRYLAIADYEDRFVIPTSHRELAKEAFPDAHGERGGCGFSFGNGCSGGDSEFSMFGGRKNTSTMVQKLTTVKQVDPKQLQE